MKILSSRYNKDIEQKIYSLIKEDHTIGRKAYLVVPEQFTLQNEIKLMEILGAVAVSDIKITSFKKMALESLSVGGGKKRKYIDDIGKTMTVKSIFLENQEDFVLYGGCMDKTGFVESLVSTISEMKRSMITPEILKIAGVSGNQLLSRKISELAFMYSKFEEKLAGKYVDNEDRIGQFAEIKDLSHLKDTKIYFYSFLSFTELENQVIKNFVEFGIDVTIALNMDAEALKNKQNTSEDAFRITEKTYSKLKEICTFLETKFIEEEINKKYKFNYNSLGEEKFDEIKFLGDNLYKAIPSKYNYTPQKINIYSAHNSNEEVRNVAIDINHKIKEQGYRYKDITIIPADRIGYLSTVKQIFTEHEIPFFVDEKRKITASPIIKSLISILNIIEYSFRTQDMILFLKNGFSLMSTNECEIFENHIIKRKMKGQMFLEDKYFKEEYNYEDQFEQEIVEKVRAYLIECFGPALSISSEKRSAREFAKELFDLIISLKLSKQVEAFVETLKTDKFIDEANENGQIWNIFVKIVDQSVEMLGETKISYSEYHQIILEGIKNYQLAVVPPSKDQVIVGDIDRSRSMDKKIVYVLGMNNNSVPRVKKDSDILTQEDKEALRKNGINLPSHQNELDDNETLLIYNLLTKPEDKLYLSYAADVEGTSAIASTILTQIKNIYPNLKYQNARSFDPTYYIAAPKPTISKMAGEIKKFTSGDIIDNMWLDVFSYFTENEKYKNRALTAIDGIFYHNKRNPIGKQVSTELYKTPLKVSTTRIDSFNKCPFSHFIKYGIKAKERKIYNIEPAEMGLVLHSTIEEFVKNLKDDLPLLANITKSESEELIGKLFDESSKKLLKEYDLEENRNQHILAKLKKTANRIGYNSIEQIRLGEFEIKYQEIKFGEERDVPPLIIEIDGEKIFLEGTIDRVDVLVDGEKQYIKVIDYKTRNKSFNLSDVYNAIDIQLIVYMSAMLQKKEREISEKYPAGVFYFPIVNPLIETETRDETQIEELIKANLRMDGIMLHDIKVINAINGCDPNNTPVVKTKGRNKIEHYLELEQFNALIEKVQENIKHSLTEMINGNIDASPTMNQKTRKTACDYCKYGSICRFDQELGEDSFRKIANYDNKTVISLLEGGK